MSTVAALVARLLRCVGVLTVGAGLLGVVYACAMWLFEPRGRFDLWPASSLTILAASIVAVLVTGAATIWLLREGDDQSARDLDFARDSYSAAELLNEAVGDLADHFDD